MLNKHQVMFKQLPNIVYSIENNTTN